MKIKLCVSNMMCLFSTQMLLLTNVFSSSIMDVRT